MEKHENKTEKISINFKKFKLFKDISQTDSVTMDVSRDFSDLMYKNMNTSLDLQYWNVLVKRK